MNVIAGNTGSGIQLGDAGNSVAAGSNTVQFNYIGTDKNAENDLGNGSDGIRLEEGTSNTIESNVVGNSEGTDAHGDGNVGIEVVDDANAVVGNLVGTNANGDDLGNRQAIVVEGSNNTIGGSSSGAGNVMAYSQFTGLSLRFGADGNTVQGNYIGTNAHGADLGNGTLGIEIYRSSDNVVGYGYGTTDLTTGGANVVASNADEGIHVVGSASTGNALRGNSIYGNGEIGIDLNNDGVTANDFGDTDTGENNLQNFPEIDQSQSQFNESTGNVEVRYKVDANPGDATYDVKVDFYVIDSASSGEGKTYVGTDTYPQVNAGAFRSVAFAPPTGVTVTRSDQIVATATDANGNTSEFTATPTQLPVELVEFKATQSGDGAVRLTWATAGETNNAGFDIEHKAGEQSFSKLGFVDGAGTTAEAQQYTFFARDLDAGNHVFRLRQVDLDGKASYSKEVEVALTMEEAYVLNAPYPNPAHHEATIDVAVREAQPVTVMLFNALGQRVRTLFDGTLPASESRSIRVEGEALTSGLYFVRMTGRSFSATKTLTFVK